MLERRKEVLGCEAVDEGITSEFWRLLVPVTCHGAPPAKDAKEFRH